jgi:hypothetical protein
VSRLGSVLRYSRLRQGSSDRIATELSPAHFFEFSYDSFLIDIRQSLSQMICGDSNWNAKIPKVAQVCW